MRLAFIPGRNGLYSRTDGMLFVLDRDLVDSVRAANSENGRPKRITVMISRGLPNHRSGFIVQTIPDNAELVRHNGFARNERGEITAIAGDTLAGRTVTRIITPGTCHDLVPVAGPGERRKPGRIYINRSTGAGIGLPAPTDTARQRQAERLGRNRHGL